MAGSSPSVYSSLLFFCFEENQKEIAEKVSNLLFQKEVWGTHLKEGALTFMSSSSPSIYYYPLFFKKKIKKKLLRKWKCLIFFFKKRSEALILKKIMAGVSLSVYSSLLFFFLKKIQ